MTGAGFYEQKPFRPTGLALVVAMHAAALGALVLVKSPIFVQPPRTITEIFDVPLPQDPPETPPPPVEADTPPPPNVFTAPPSEREMPPLRDGPAASEPQPKQEQYAGLSGTGTTAEAGPDLPLVRVDAILDPRYAADQQPPYPPIEERAQRNGQVRVRVTIGADGRVKAVQRLNATSDAFWRATERHALTSWRFRPATVDGRPVESTKVLNITFVIEA